MRRLFIALHFAILFSSLIVAVPATAAGEDTPALRQADLAYRIRFPEDEGSHPGFGEEWWYVSGWLDGADGDTLGFQITFFRLLQDHGEDGRSLSEPRQIFIGHVALSDPVQGVALHDQRSAPANSGQAEAREGAMDVRMGDWSLAKEAGGAYVVDFPTRGFTLALRLKPTQPPMLNGDRGYSQKLPTRRWRATTTACRSSQ